MTTVHPHAPPQRVTRLDAVEVHEAWRLVRVAAERLGRIATSATAPTGAVLLALLATTCGELLG